MGTGRRWATGAALAGAVLFWAEWSHRRAARQELPPAASGGAGDSEAIVVLGFPSRRGDRPGVVQRYRCRIAVRSRDPRAERSVLVFTGGSPHRPAARRSEAAVMAEYAVRALGVDPADVVLEERATNTWENIAFSLPLVEGFATVRIASNTFHARRARRYLRAQAPATADRLRAARDHRFGEFLPLKPVLALIRR